MLARLSHIPRIFGSSAYHALPDGSSSDASPIEQQRPEKQRLSDKVEREDEEMDLFGAEQNSANYRHLIKQCRHLRLSLWMMTIICACQTIALVLQHFQHAADLAPLLRTPVPRVGREMRIWQDDPTIHNLTTKEQVEASWEHLGLPESGFVSVTNPDEYGLLPNKHVIAGATNVYAVSAYHQLHCLKIMHLMFIELWTREPGDPRMSLQHIEHCIIYIKQGVTCAGDMALEGPDIGGGKLEGWGIEHECRTWHGRGGIAEKVKVLNDAMLRQKDTEPMESPAVS